MTSWIKYTLIISAIVGVLVFTVYAGLKHVSNITATQEVDVGLSSTNAGLIREELSNVMNRDEAIAEMLSKVAKTQKNHEGETQIEYVFLDENAEPTNNEEEIKSIQFDVKLLNNKGKVQSVSTERIELNKKEEL